METVQTEDKSYVRDIHSKALLSTDRVALDNHRHRQIMVSQQSFEWQQMKIKVSTIFPMHMLNWKIENYNINTDCLGKNFSSV